MNLGPTKDSDVKELLKDNSIKKDIDYLYLVRELGDLPRCHALGMTNRPSLASHILNCVYLVNFVFANKLVRANKLIDEKETFTVLSRTLIQDYMIFHDVEESLTGDVPYHANKHMKEGYSLQVRNDICARFDGVTDSHPLMDKHNLDICKQIDMIEFMMSIEHDPTFTMETFAGNRLRDCYENARLLLINMFKKSRFFVDPSILGGRI